MKRLSLAPLLLATALAPAAHAACPEPIRRADLALGIEEAKAAFGRLDRHGFAEARAEVLAGLPCLVEPVHPGDAAGIHGLEALNAFLAHDDAAAVTALQAALQADPGFVLPGDLFPEGHPLRTALRAAQDLAPGPGQPLPRPARGTLTVDGRPAAVAPTDRPAVLQWIAPPSILGTELLRPSEPLPDWGRPPRPTPDHRPVGWLLASGGAAALAGGLWGLAAAREAVLLDPATAYDDLPGLRAQADALTVGAWVAGAAAVGCGVTAGIRW